MKPLQPGELSYRGRRVNPETFKQRGKDLRRLVGKCMTCGRTLRGSDAIPAVDSYNYDINDDSTLVVQCCECNSERAQDI